MSLVQHLYQKKPPPSHSELLTRLRNGQAWLSRTHSELLAMDNAGVGSKLETQFNYALDTWVSMENLYRAVSHSDTCITGFECVSDSTVLCKACENHDV